jgi:sulfopyruvate decarboxylase TPP-binding subunit
MQLDAGMPENASWSFTFLQGRKMSSASYSFAAGDWRAGIFDALKANDVRQMAYVPDAGHASLIKECHGDTDIDCTVLTTEEEGVALLAGADLGHQRGVMLMQSSGVGNCVNMFSLLKSCGFPFVTLVTMRGEWAEFNPWQVQMGQATEETFKRSGFVVYRADTGEDAAAMTGSALRMAYDSNCAVAVLLSQRLIGAKNF